MKRPIFDLQSRVTNKSNKRISRYVCGREWPHSMSPCGAAPLRLAANYVAFSVLLHLFISASNSKLGMEGFPSNGAGYMLLVIGSPAYSAPSLQPHSQQELPARQHKWGHHGMKLRASILLILYGCTEIVSN